MQPVGITAPLQDTASLFIHDLYLVVHHHIFHIFFKEGIGLDQLVYRVNAFCFDGVVEHQRILLLDLLLF